MPLVPGDWNVVVVGHWNRAIFTPAGIAKRLFQLGPDIPVEVLVPLDTFAPYQVRHEDVTVVAGSDRLIIQPATTSYPLLSKAKEVAIRAVNELPHTPMTATGFNLRYRSTDPVETLQEMTSHAWDDRLSDLDYEIQERVITRLVGWRKGRIRIMVTQNADLSFSVLINFDLQSEDVNLIREWLSVPVSDVQEEADRLLFTSLGLHIDEVQNA